MTRQQYYLFLIHKPHWFSGICTQKKSGLFATLLYIYIFTYYTYNVNRKLKLLFSYRCALYSPFPAPSSSPASSFHLFPRSHFYFNFTFDTFSSKNLPISSASTGGTIITYSSHFSYVQKSSINTKSFFVDSESFTFTSYSVIQHNQMDPFEF